MSLAKRARCAVKTRRAVLWGLAICVLCLGLAAASGDSAARPLTDQPNLRFPFMGKWRVIQGYGIDDSGNEVAGTHRGTYALDFVRMDGPTKGATVYAAHGGTVINTGRHQVNGAYVRIADGADPAYCTYYLHLATIYEGIAPGAKVEAGTPLGELGHCDGPNAPSPCTDHLHFALTNNWSPVKPEPMGGMSGFYHGVIANGCTDDDTPPDINFFDKPDGGGWYGQDRRIAWSVSDDGCGVRGFAWAWDRRPTSDEEQPGSNGEAQLTGAGEGMHTLYVVAWDTVGNRATSSLASLGYDATPPETYMDTDTQEFAQGDLVTLTWRGWDHIEGPAYQYSHQLEGVEDWSPWMSSTQASYSDLPPGSYTFYAKAKDQAGNEDPTPAALSFTVR